APPPGLRQPGRLDLPRRGGGRMTATRGATRRSGRTAGRLAAGLLGVLLIAGAQRVDPVDAAAPKWSEPVAVSHSGDGWFPDVAADAVGNVHVVWQGGFGDA